MLNYHSFRCGVADDLMCSCDTETETTEHFFLHRPLYADRRKNFFRALTLSGPLLEHVVHGKELYNFFSDVRILVLIAKDRTRNLCCASETFPLCVLHDRFLTVALLRFIRFPLQTFSNSSLLRWIQLGRYFRSCLKTGPAWPGHKLCGYIQE